MDTVTNHPAHTWQAVASAVLVCVVCLLIPRFSRYVQYSRLPLFQGTVSGEEQRKVFLNSAHKLYLDGYHKFKNSAYRMPTADDRVNIVIPMRFLSELRKLADSVLSVTLATQRDFEAKYTNVPTELPMVGDFTRASLTPALARITPVMYTEVDHFMRQEFPPCEDWTPISAHVVGANMVARITGRIFVGPELCRNPEYLDTAVHYAMDVLKAQKAIKRVRPWLRPILASRLPAVRRLREREQRVQEFLRPIVQERLNAAAKDPHWQKPDDMLSALISHCDKQGGFSEARLAKTQLDLSFAAIHTTSEGLTHILYDLAVKPEYIQPLREEISTVLTENGGAITNRGLQQMLKLDSFMKESLRFYPIVTTVMNRVVTEGFTLSNGQFIPRGSSIVVPSRAAHLDPANYPDGESFDGLRHYKLRHGGAPTDQVRNQFVTSDERSLLFGYGRHACPGRFFGTNEIKMILVRLIIGFDIKNEDGSTERYPNLESGNFVSPNKEKKLLFKRRVDEGVFPATSPDAIKI